jgi:cytochrome c oxidase subunit 2
MINEAELEKGKLRMLDVDNRLILPELTHARFNISSTDVIHSLGSPSLGLKCDAYPFKLNQISVYANRESVNYGQCSEICGL